MKHSFWHHEAWAVHQGTRWRSVGSPVPHRTWEGWYFRRSEVAANLLRDMPDPCELMERQYIIPSENPSQFAWIQRNECFASHQLMIAASFAIYVELYLTALIA